MRQLFHRTITVLDNAFRRLDQQVPPPQLVPFGDGEVYRFTEKLPEQALLLKFARVATGLKALDLLLVNGLLQEVGAICRMLDEICEDITFIAAALTNDKLTELHERYLSAFWEEQFPDPSNSLARHAKPDTPRRSKVQSYIQRVLNPDADASLVADVTHSLSTTYSGYIHASAPQILDMYGGSPVHFHIEGMQGTPLQADHIYDAWNYFYRAIAAAIFVSRAFGDESLSDALGEYHDKFLDSSGPRAADETIKRVNGKKPPRRPENT